MNAQEIVKLAITTMITILMSFIAWQSSRWSSSIDALSKSVIELNTKMQVLVGEITIKNENVEHILSDHESRIRTLEKK